jgi:hypothetical protein
MAGFNFNNTPACSPMRSPPLRLNSKDSCNRDLLHPKCRRQTYIFHDRQWRERKRWSQKFRPPDNDF